MVRMGGRLHEFRATTSFERWFVPAGGASFRVPPRCVTCRQAPHRATAECGFAGVGPVLWVAFGWSGVGGQPPMKRSRMKPTRSKRDWTAMRAKVLAEGRCRRCHATWALEAAHIIPRSRIGPGLGEQALNCVPLCRDCHALQHAGHVDLFPLLTTQEWEYAVGLVGEGEAERRLGKAA